MGDFGDSSVMGMGDIQFMSEMEKSNNLVSIISPVFTDLGEKISFIVPNNKKFFFVKASLVPFGNITYNAGMCNATVKLDTLEIDALGYNASFYKFTQSMGPKAAAGGVGMREVSKLETTIFGKSLQGDNTKKATVTVNAISNFRGRIVFFGYMD